MPTKKIIGKVIKLDDVEIVNRTRPGKYRVILDAIAKLDPNETYRIPIPGGMTYKKLKNRLNSAILNHKVAPEDHHFHFGFRMGTSNTLLVVLVKKRK